MEKKIVISGGAGFIGTNLVRFFLERDPRWSVTVIDDFSTGLESNLDGLDVNLVRGSILDLDLLRSASRGVDAFVHLAAIGSVPRSIKWPRPTHDANVTGTLNVLETVLFNEIPNVIVASSSSVYGSNPSLPRSELDWTRPMSPYGVSKLATEAYALAFAHSYGLKTLAFRFFNVYGPFQRADHPYAAVIPKFISAAVRGEKLSIFGDGEQSRDFTYVESVCEALYLSCERELACDKPVNLAFGSRTTLNDLVGIVETALGTEVKVEYQAPRVGDVRESQADSRLLESLLPDLSRYELSVGIEKTLDWFRTVS